MSKNSGRVIWLPLVFSLLIAGSFYLGYRYKNFQQSDFLQSHSFLLNNNNPLNQTLQLINQLYVDSVDMNEKYDETIDYLVRQLDPHSYYIPPKEMLSVEEDLNGSFEGVGIEFFIVRDTVQVVTPIPGGPSEQLGIMSGDQIIKVNDSTIAGVGITNDEVIKKLKGKKGTKVKVGIKRLNQAKLIDFDIKRDKIPIYSVDAGFKIDNHTGYIKIGRFSGTTAQEFRDKLSDLKNQGINQLIIDLRQNPGGFLEEVVKIVGEFIDVKKEVVFVEGRSVEKKYYYPDYKGLFLQGKVAILIDEGSASASEIFAGAIQDWDRGIILGRRSFGKGLVQQQYALENGGALRLTIAKYYTPSGRCIQRPYQAGHNEEYEHDIEERYTDGELFDEDDNFALAKQDTNNKYHTKVLNRPVFGGGGIAPDVYIPLDTTYLNAFSLEVFANGWIQDYTYNYFNKHSQELKKYKNVDEFVTHFNSNDDFYNSFIFYCKNDKKAKNIASSSSVHVKNEIKKRLIATLARQIFNNDGYYQIMMKQDELIQKALQQFSSKSYSFK
ncbi:MAG: S41 family peptidase [Chitinophagales bacterium]|nr:S41 family peptidase [Chitinophagales bacterium]